MTPVALVAVALHVAVALNDADAERVSVPLDDSVGDGVPVAVGGRVGVTLAVALPDGVHSPTIGFARDAKLKNGLAGSLT